MTFDPKAMLGSQAFSVAGGVVIGLGIFTLIRAGIEHLVQPLFNVVFDNNGMVALSRSNGIYIGCGPFLGACIVTVACVIIGFFMIRTSPK
jgi:hypothetical protein